MYKKNIVILYLTFVLLGISIFISEKTDEIMMLPAFQMTVEELEDQLGGRIFYKKQMQIHNYRKDISSKQRKISYTILTQKTPDIQKQEKNPKNSITGEEVEVLCRLVEAEAGGESLQGKKLVAHVVLNRMNDEQFPDSVSEVIFDRRQGITQFSPVSDGRFYQVRISDETRVAVTQALTETENAQGALYFVNSSIADKGALSWFEDKCTYLFTYGNHDFFS